MNLTLPKNWRSEPLGKCCTIVSGATPRRNVPEYWDHHIPWVTPKDISNLDGPILEDTPEYISRAGYKSCSATLLPKGSVLFSSRAPIGLVALTGREMCTNQGFKSLVPGKHVHSEYLYHCMKWMAPKIAELGNGATFKEVSKEVVSRVDILLPPLAEQKRIAAILDKADSIRRKRQQAIKLADDFLRATFLDMFGDPVTNPKGWEQHRLGSICDVGSSNRVFVNELVEAGIPFYRGTEIGQLGDDNVVDPSLFITKEHYERLKAQSGVPRIGDLLLPSICPDGRIYLVKNEDPFYFKDGRVLWIKVDGTRINSKFLKNHLKLLFFTGYSKIASGTTFAELKIFSLKDLTIHVPPVEIQERFATIVETIEQLKTRLCIYKTDIDTLFASLTQRAFRGEL